MSTEPIEARLRALFSEVGARGFVCVREIGPGAAHADELDADAGAVELDADAPVSLASVVKILIALAFARQVAAGAIDPTERTNVPSHLRVGGTGTTGCLDPVQMSLRDLALSMMNVSDNAATDVVLARTGRSAVEAVISDLELEDTHLRGDMAWGHELAVRSLGLTSERDLDAQLEAADPDAVRGLAWLDPAHANASTPREIARLLEAIWTNRGGPAEACEFVRSLMAQQVSTQRLASGVVLDGARVAAKSGTIPTIRNEAGVITYPDGRRFAAAVFTRASSVAARRPDIDAAIGKAAALAIAELKREAS
jgi:beta-lactamase class A